MIKRLRTINKALPGLMAGIVFFGVLCQVLGVWFVEDKIGYSIGLWIGVITALFMGIHMAWSLNMAMDFGEGATKLMMKHNLLRYGVVVIVMGVVVMTQIANPLMTFLGLMSLKVAAYLQPITDKIFNKKVPDDIIGE